MTPDPRSSLDALARLAAWMLQAEGAVVWLVTDGEPPRGAVGEACRRVLIEGGLVEVPGAWVGAPLHLDGALTGVLVVYGRDVRLTEGARDALRTVADQVVSTLRLADRGSRSGDAALHRSEARHGALLMALPDTIYRLGPHGPVDLVAERVPGARSRAGAPPVAQLAGVASPGPGEVVVVEYEEEGQDYEARLVRTDEGEILAIVRDISERKRSERRKEEFVSIVSHELRTPLTSIRGSLGLIAGGVVGDTPSAMRDLVNVACANADRLIRLVNDLLDIDKIEAGRLELDIERVDAVELVEGAANTVRGIADMAGVRIRREVDRPVAIAGDRDRLHQVLTNLLSNAVRYSPFGEVVTVTIRTPAPGRVRLTVRDHGPGIPPDRVPLLFRKYAQLGTGDGRRRGGTGLGLAISKAIVDQHGGQIGVEPCPPPGTVFFVELPEDTRAIPLPTAEDPLADLRAGYAATLPGLVDTLLQLVAEARVDRARNQPAMSLAHRLHGTAGTYGFGGVSAAAARIERLLEVPVLDDAALDEALGALQASVPAPVGV